MKNLTLPNILLREGVFSHVDGRVERVDCPEEVKEDLELDFLPAKLESDKEAEVVHAHIMECFRLIMAKLTDEIREKFPELSTEKVLWETIQTKRSFDIKKPLYEVFLQELPYYTKTGMNALNTGYTQAIEERIVFG